MPSQSSLVYYGVRVSHSIFSKYVHFFIKIKMFNFPDETWLSLKVQTHRSPPPLFFSIFPGHLPLWADS